MSKFRYLALLALLFITGLVFGKWLSGSSLIRVIQADVPSPPPPPDMVDMGACSCTNEGGGGTG